MAKGKGARDRRGRTGRSGDHHNADPRVTEAVKAINRWQQVQTVIPGAFRRQGGGRKFAVRFQRMDGPNKLKCVARTPQGLQELTIVAKPSSGDGNVKAIQRRLTKEYSG